MHLYMNNKLLASQVNQTFQDIPCTIYIQLKHMNEPWSDFFPFTDFRSKTLHWKGLHIPFAFHFF